MKKSVIPDIELAEWREAFIKNYRENRRYKNEIACRLQPLWRPLVSAGHVNDFTSFSQCRYWCPAARKYATEIERFVVEHMRLTSNGKPADWACDYVHADASVGRYGVIEPGGGAMVGSVEDISIKVEVSMTGASVRLVREYLHIDQHHSQSVREQEIKRREIHGSEMFSFDNFAGVREAADDLIQGWLAEVQDKWSKVYPQRYTGKAQARRENHRQLFAYLYSHEKIVYTDEAGRKRLKRAAADLKIDFPPGQE